MLLTIKHNWSSLVAAVALASLLVAALGCAAEKKRSGDGIGDPGGDADADADTDADTDTDSDSDGPVIPATCEAAATTFTSVGCEFFAVDLDNYDYTNGIADLFPFSVVVSNPHLDQQADVSIEEGNEGVIIAFTLAPLELRAVDLTCSMGGDCLLSPHEINDQGIGEGLAFRVTSSVPVLAYQWNNYGAEVHSTDASLLLPVTSLDGTYIVGAWDDGPSGDAEEAGMPIYRSQVTIAATQDDTQLTVTPSFDVDEAGGVGPIGAGQVSETFTLNKHDVLAVSSAGVDNDLTGTVVQADKPVAVFGSHACANVPVWYVAACDHVEEQMLPLAAWGTSSVLARYAPRGQYTIVQDAVIWRIIAGAGDMTITFDPPAPLPVGAEHVFASQGEVLELESPVDHLVTGIYNDPPDPEDPGAPFLAYQMMTGCEYVDFDNSIGDPMMIQAAPAGQYLDRYVFNTDDVFDFDQDHIVVIRAAGSEVQLDCVGVLDDEEFAQVGDSDWEVARIYIDHDSIYTGCEDGVHVISADEPVGLSVAGTSTCNSYGYLGGVGLRPINPGPVIE
jgi:hypothetical protein